MIAVTRVSELFSDDRLILKKQKNPLKIFNMQREVGVFMLIPIMLRLPEK